MTFLLTLFFASLVGITTMIGRKVLMLQSNPGHHAHMQTERFLIEIPHIAEVRRSVARGMKITGYAVLVLSLRAYVKSSNFLAQQYKNLKKRIPQEKTHANEKGASSFLQMMSEYKRKVRRIKHKIAEEEKSL